MYLSFQRVASSSSVKTVEDLTVPAKATYAEIQADTQAVRYTMDGTNPTDGSGMLFLTTSDPKQFLIEDVKKLKFIQGTGGAGAINIHYFAGRDI
jgi:hypothetical protein